MKLYKFFSIVFALLLVVTAVTSPALAAEPLDIEATSALLLELNSGQLLFEQNADATIYPASLTKIMTSLLVLENGTTTVRTVSLSESGLVSPMAVYTYTIENVIEGITLTDPAVDRAVREYLMVGADHPLYSNELWAIDSFILPEE